MIEFKGKKQLESNNFSSEHIGDEVVPITSETPSYEDRFETKLEAKFYKSDKVSNKNKYNWCNSRETGTNNQNRLEKNWFPSTQKHCASQKLLKF